MGTPARSASTTAGYGCATGDTVGVAVGGDHPLQDPPVPGGFGFDVVGVGEQDEESVALPVGELDLTGVQGATRPIEGVVLEAAVAVRMPTSATAVPAGTSGIVDGRKGVLTPPPPPQWVPIRSVRNHNLP